MNYTWHEEKSEDVRRKHAIEFAKLLDIFSDPYAVEFIDETHSSDEETRYAIIGATVYRLVYLVFTEIAKDELHFITARLAKIGWSKNMKKTEKDTDMETSKEAQKAGLKRIERKHFVKSGEVKLSDCKVKITINLDADILEYFKQRAAPPHSAPYQTQINNELRRLMESDDSTNDLSQTARELLKDDNFIVALKDRLKVA